MLHLNALLALALVLTAAPLAAGGGGRALHELQGAPICEQGYTITGECVYDYGMQVEAGGEVLRFEDKCKWTPTLRETAENAIGCIKDTGSVAKYVCKFLKIKPAAALTCKGVCFALEELKTAISNKRDCQDNGKKDGSAGGFCFPGAARVRVRGGALAPLSTVLPGEEILAVTPDGRTQYSEMFTLTAPLPTHRGTFVRLHTSAGLNVTVTPNHFLFSLPAATALAEAHASLNAWRYTLPTKL